MLNETFLIAAILVVIVLLIYILYWNRLLALILSLVLRVALWNKGGSSVWIQIGAQDSTIFSSCPRPLTLLHRQALSTFHSCRDESSSRTFDTTRATNPSKSSKSSYGGNTGFVTSPLPSTFKPMPAAKSQNVRSVFSFQVAVITVFLLYVAGHKLRSPRCRFHATFEGFEWFIYNRTAAFNNIVAQMEAKTPVPERRTQSFTGDGAASQLRQIFSKSSTGGEGSYRTLTFLEGYIRPVHLR